MSMQAVIGRTAERLPRRGAALLATLGLGVALLAGGLGATGRAPVATLDRALLDGVLRHTASGETARGVAVVDIDDVSLSAVGQWPWPRYRLAALIERVAAEQPAAIALDILLPEADRASLTTVRDTFRRDFGVELSLDGVPSGLLDNDGYLAEVVARRDVVAGRYFYFDHSGASADVPASAAIAIEGRDDLLDLDVATGVLESAGPIAARTRSAGFVNTQIDPDGVLRRVPLLIAHGGRAHPSLALAALTKALGVASARVESGASGLALVVGPHRVPIDAKGYATLRFAGGPERYPAIPALGVLDGSAPLAGLRGKVVFIGSSAAGLNDLHNTALDARFPGVRIQAAMAENVLRDRHVQVPSWRGSAVLAACLALAAAMVALFVLGSGIALLVGGSVALAAGALAASVGLYLGTGIFVSGAAPAAVVAVLFVAFALARFGLERQRVQAGMRALANARQVTIESMAAVAETRDPETGAHIKRTQHYVRAIASELRRAGHHLDVLTPEYIELLFLSAPLHDVGKVGVPDHILMKPGRLTFDEMEQMKRHAEFGRSIIGSSARHIDGDNFLTIAGEIAATHHEKWDGTGYPHGLAGADIPLSGRIMAVADVYDALISRRCYKEPFPHAVATKMMRDLRGSTFDPLVLDTFFAIEDEIEAIAARYRDAEGDEPHASLELPAAERATRAPPRHSPTRPAPLTATV
ncbi:CHASE2 domain-containing protein [Piscinibacter koreensis]|uniref:CHASE2 domain-containing protein n=1 Tax=Piscinibacter koreensis TaxID=2742824 RepID=A0A7Y6NLE4_9BURK|nr:CHASE2 domain-containing protein [Schlegelella koreensis]NUZ05280.1 CHASE2 domain-containing protein [Schlegelella koreensis]